MKTAKVKKLIYGILLLLIVFILDRISKNLILNIAEEIGKVDIYLNPYLNFYLVWNKGIGFGLLSFSQDSIYDAITFFIFLINLAIIYLIYIEKGIKIYFLVIILGGSFGNLFDRIYYRAVPDFIDLNYNDFHWFIFNVADIFITIGIICIILIEIINYKKQNEKEN
tara:strand:- start:238 stop:738 length:501 start_codon:yes stop_codon:yes gene_type:complete